MKFGIGQAVKRVEDKVLITGSGNFTDDVNVGEGMAIHFVRSAHAHANIKYINFEEASKRSGVKLIATQKELDDENIGEIECLDLVTNSDGSEISPSARPPMARGVVRCAGDIVAMVVAETKEQALDAAELIEIDYDAMPAVVDTESALAPKAPQLYTQYPGNRVFHWQAGNHDETMQQFETACMPDDSCLLYTSPSPRDRTRSRMPSSA